MQKLADYTAKDPATKKQTRSSCRVKERWGRNRAALTGLAAPVGP